MRCGARMMCSMIGAHGRREKVGFSRETPAGKGHHPFVGEARRARRQEVRESGNAAAGDVQPLSAHLQRVYLMISLCTRQIY